MLDNVNLQTIQARLEQIEDYEQVKQAVDDLSFQLCLQWLWARLDAPRREQLLTKARELAAN